jgi:hypothetical protein
VRWVTFAIFALGMMASLNWHQAVTRERKTIFGVVAVAAFAVVLVLGSTML